MKAWPLLLALAAGCGSARTPPPLCEGLDPEACLLPWPSSALLVRDRTTRTGFRVALAAATMPRNKHGAPVDPAPWNRWDGFSPMTTLIAEIASVIDPSPLPTWHDPGASLAADSPTVLVDVDTGERIAHFAEIESSPEVAAGHTTLYVRPAARLAEGHHYAVGIRGLRNRDGSSAAAAAPFAQLRDRLPGALDARRDSFEHDVFAPLAAAGVARASLLLAWDFRTASGETAWGDLLAMRDAAVAAAGPGGLGCSVSQVSEDPTDAEILRRIEGQFTVPNFLAPGRLVRGADGRPAQQGTAQAAFTAIVPRSAAAGAPVWIYGHGLFSARDEVTRDFARDTASQAGAIAAATDFTGLTQSDLGDTVAAFEDVSAFVLIPDRVRQGIVNTILLPRTIAGACAALPAFAVSGRPLPSTTDFDYFGNSMGGTLGQAVAAVSPDLARVALGVGGIDFPVMMPRSTRWPLIEIVFRDSYPRRLDRDLLTVMAAQEWDLFEASAFAPHLLADPLPGSHPVRLLFQVGLYDADTTNVASEIAGRTLGLSQLSPSAHPVWGLPPAAGPLQSGYVVYDLGKTPVPDWTIAPAADNGVHEGVRRDPRAQAQIVSFLHAGGAVIDTCHGPCGPLQ